MSLLTLCLLDASLLSHQKTWSCTHFQLNLALLQCNQSKRQFPYQNQEGHIDIQGHLHVPRYRQNGDIFHPGILHVYSIQLKTKTLNSTWQPDQLCFASKAFPKPFSQTLGILNANKNRTKTFITSFLFWKGGAGRLVSTPFVGWDGGT